MKRRSEEVFKGTDFSKKFNSPSKNYENRPLGNSESIRLFLP